jgi:hypothetical protein
MDKDMKKRLYVNSKEGIEKRKRVKDDFRIRSDARKVMLLQQRNLLTKMKFWSLFGSMKNRSNYGISREEYIECNVKIAKALLPNFKEDVARSIALVSISIRYWNYIFKIGGMGNG